MPDRIDLRDPNQCAYPTPAGSPGMSIRTVIAMHAMQGLLAAAPTDEHGLVEVNYHQLSREAFERADSLIAEHNRTSGENTDAKP